MNSLQDLVQFKNLPVSADYPLGKVIKFYSPQDKCHEAFKALLSSATQSIHLSMYGEDDQELTDIIVQKAQDPTVFVQINLDKTQAAGRGEVPLVKELEGCPATRVAVGMSRYHKINHLKVAVVDGRFLLSGSTNWSADGEARQNNEASIHDDRVLAQEAITILNLEHQEMLDQAKENPH